MPRGTPFTPDYIRKVIAARMTVHTHQACADKLGVSLRAVEKALRAARDMRLLPNDALRPARNAAAPGAVPPPRKLREDQIADALAARLETPAISAGSGGEDVDPPVGALPPVYDRVALSLMARGLSRDRAIAEARVHRARQAEQVAARSARAVLSDQSRVHRPQNMPDASR